MAVYCTEENQKDECFAKSLLSVIMTTDFSRHRMILSVNGATEETKRIISYYPSVSAIFNDENIGTARAINKVWKHRLPGEHCVKMDDDIVIKNKYWADELEEAISRDPLIGQIGLKRKDCWEKPTHESDDFRSDLFMLPQQAGERWIIVEKAKHIIGSCVMHSSGLLDKVGYLYQPSLYGYDDVIMSHRTHIAGFYSCFLPHIEIDHIDDGKTPYQDWKHKHSGDQTQNVIALVHEMYKGTKPIFYNEY